MRSDGTTGEWAIDKPELPGVAGTLAFERFIDGMEGRRSQKMVVGNIDRIAFVTIFFQADDAPTWDDVLHAAARQAEKVRSALSPGQ
jgi:hypothetical protein